jgi:GxxExxY protein
LWDFGIVGISINQNVVRFDRQFQWMNKSHVEKKTLKYFASVTFTRMSIGKYEELTGKIIGCAMKVHQTLGNGFQEVIYQRALEIELDINRVSHQREFEMPIFYRDVLIETRRVDFLVNRIISVEIKAIIGSEGVHLAQALNYLQAYNLEIGLLINFGAKSMQFNRLLNKKYKPPAN